ncbi:hypothetical protein ANO11243_062410 [Dothideomycetidae sp. 11243]|nr:hypothetical protein ANO11243_062410 [fungal sp. No.11243]
MAASKDQSPDIALATLTSSQTEHDVNPADPSSIEAPPDTPEPIYPTGLKFFIITISVGLVLILGGLDLNVVATAVPAITDHFHTVADVGWYAAAYRLTTCAFQFFFGKLYKLFAIKWVFLASIVIFMCGSVLCASASSSKMFVLGRAVCGLGCSGGIAGCFIILTQICSPQKRPLMTSLFGLIEAVASICGPILGGVLTQRLSWRWCFWIALPIGGITLPAIAFTLDVPREQDATKYTWKEIIIQLDPVGNLIFVPSMTCLFIALSWAGTKYSWSDPKVIGLLVTFAVLSVIFILDQRRKGDDAILPMRILKQRTVIAALIFSVCCNSSLEVIEYYMPTYFQIVRGYPPAKSGLMMLPVIGGGMAGMLLFGSGTTVIGYYTPFMLLSSITMPVAAGLMTTWRTTSSTGKLISCSLFAGFATCLGIMAPQSAVQNFLDPKDVPLGIALVSFTHNFGPALVIAVGQTILTNRLVANLKDAIPGLSANVIDNVGLSELQTNVTPQNMQKVLFGVDGAVIQTWYLAIALTCVSIVGSLLMEWKSVKQKKN